MSFESPFGSPFRSPVESPFGSPFRSPVESPFKALSNPAPPRVGLSSSYSIGTRLGIGTDSSFWVGSFGGIQDGVALLINAQLFANVGKPIDGIRPVVRIPIKQITFVSQ
ncbi:hypothetical protein [Desulfosporosinus metallidurans]|uniref:hypothetical protein n=1 Tax=Desulfosporosinus metallidurans TaxID=1888891 RepID=UPI001F3BD334|nr:hypothetical protein [Desulfosporosinus metallidurans]